MNKKIKLLFLSFIFTFGLSILLTSCIDKKVVVENNSLEEEKKVVEPVTEDFNNDEIIEDVKIENEIEIVDIPSVEENVIISEDTSYGPIHVINYNTGNPNIGASYVQISAATAKTVNMRYVFEIKNEDCDYVLTRTVYEKDKITVVKPTRTIDISTLYTGYYVGNDLVTSEGIKYVVYSMRGIPTEYWDCYFDVTLKLYESGTDTEVAGFDNVQKNALTILYAENSSVLDSDFEFSNGTLTAYNGSDTTVVVPEKALVMDGDDAVYTEVTEIAEEAFVNTVETLILPASIITIGSNIGLNSAKLLFKGAAYTGSNNTSVDVLVFSDSYAQDAWHYKDGTPRLWAKSIKITDAQGANETAVVSFNVASDAENTDFNVYYTTDKSTYNEIDHELILIDGTVAKAYIPGSVSGTYYVKVELDEDPSEYEISSRITVSEQDRSGYAHFNYDTDDVGVGAYLNTGALKAGTDVIYVTNETKNTVSVTWGGNTYTGIANILANLKEASNPVCVRFLDTIEAATWSQIDYKNISVGSTETISNSPVTRYATSLFDIVVKNSEGTALTASKTTQQELIDGSYNTLDTSLYSELKNLTSYMTLGSSVTKKYTPEGGSETNVTVHNYDSYWNMCDISSAENITIEGIGESAGLFQWGLAWKNCKSIEVKNLTFDDYTEDACGIEGSKSSSNLSDYDDLGRYWIHNNTFNEGKNYWDVGYEQDKHEGDGATDIKKTAYATYAYNHYLENHKTGLVGNDDAAYTACVTFHHNYYENCTSRMPLGRNANMHMYNNYYYGSTGTNMSIRSRGYAFVENCVFEDCKNPVETAVGTKDGFKDYTGVVKAYNNEFTNCTGTNNATIVAYNERAKEVANSNSYGVTFDTNSTIFYYDGTKSDVDIMTNTDDVPTYVPTHAGAGSSYYESLKLVEVETVDSLSLNLYKLSGSNGTYYTNHVKTIYKAGDSFDSTYLTINANDTLTNTNNCIITGYSSSVGKHTITVDYKDKSASYDVYVLPSNLNYYNVAVGSQYSIGDTTIINGEEYLTFQTIEQALQYLRQYTNPTASNRANLYITAGYYEEKLEIDIPYLTITGAGYAKATYTSDESYDASEYNYATIIEWNSLYGVTETGLVNDTNSSATVEVKASAVALEINNLTISNKNNCYSYFTNVVGSHAEHRALALLVRADQFVMNNSALLGYQDTLELMTGRQYFYNCYISGTTDYIFGTNNATLFDNCIIHTIYNGNTSAGGYITAFKGCHSNASDAVSYGVTFYQCILEGDSNTVNVSLGRPWGSYAQVSYIECEMANCISTTEYTNGTNQGQRYVRMKNNDDYINPTDANVRFYEYGNTGAGAISSTQNGMTYLSAAEAAKCYDYAYIFGKTNGNVAYSLAWDPINGTEADNNIYYIFHGATPSTGTAYVFDSSDCDVTGNYTVGDLTFTNCQRRTVGNDDLYVGGSITFDVNAGTTVTITSYPGYYAYKIGDVYANANTVSYYFENAQENVVIERSGSAAFYLYSIVINESLPAPTTPTLDSITVSGYSEDDLQVGTDYNLSNLKVKAFYSDSTYKFVTGFTTNAATVVNKDAAGTYTVTVSYGGMTDTFDITYVSAVSDEFDSNFTITFGNNGNYAGLSKLNISDSTKVRNNGDNDTQIYKDNVLTFKVKPGALIQIVGNWSVGYSINNEEVRTTNASGTDDTGLNHTYLCTTDTVTITSLHNNNYFITISITYYDIETDTTISFGSSGNYSSNSKVYVSNARDNGGNNSEVSNATILFNVKAGATISISSYSGYTNYIITVGSSTSATQTGTSYEVTATNDSVVIITTGSNNYFYSISIAY